MAAPVLGRLGVIGILYLTGDLMSCGTDADMHETRFCRTDTMLKGILDEGDEDERCDRDAW